ncbi:MAG: ABC transporter permease [Chloroflexi bacterium]|nr:ABC transporter permease [Chloroflexota bacterium]
MQRHIVDNAAGTAVDDKADLNNGAIVVSEKATARRAIWSRPAAYLVPPTAALATLVSTWEIWLRIANVPVYILPLPSVIFSRLVGDLGFFAWHGGITLLEALAGFALGTAVALVGATLMAHSRFLERSLLPIAVLVKVTPVVAVAPLFVIWFGFGSLPKIFIAALITFFPVLVNAMTGLRAVEPGALDYFRSLSSSRKEIYLKLRLPGALPYLFAAFRISIPLSVIGAVVGEWFSGDRGLGSVIIMAHSNLDMPTLFSAILTLAFLGISLTLLTFYLERKILFWHPSNIVT